MILIGQYDSPYVRRVAIALTMLGLPFTRSPLSVFSDAVALRRINPLGRVPALVLDDGEVIVDSAAILDHLDERVGPGKALVPPSGAGRRRALRIMSLATGVNDKAVALASERFFRSPETRYQPWIDRLQTQLHEALTALEAEAPADDWFLGSRPMAPDITAACMLGYVRLRAPDVGILPPIPKLTALSRRAEDLDAFRACRPSTEEIGGQEAGAAEALARYLGEAE